MSDPLDPFGLARQWVTQWEKLVNDHGADLLAWPETTQAIQAFTTAALKAQAVSNEATGRMLAAANLPSRADIEALSQRLAAVETALGRIERHLQPGDPAPRRPAVRRTRKPPADEGA